MTPLFADAGYWIALTFGQDRLHAFAVRLTVLMGSRLIVTSEMVLTEFWHMIIIFSRQDL